MKTHFRSFALNFAVCITMLLAMAVGIEAHAQTPQLLVGTGPASSSAPVCGGFVNGKWQPACGGVPARFEGNVNYNCPAGSFFDASGGCWSCPAGYKRSAEGVTSERACDKADASVKGVQFPATFGGSLCPAGSFKDGIRGGECWSCPSGYQRSAASVEAANACYIPASEAFSGAQRQSKGMPAWDGHKCVETYGSYGFYDVWDLGGCWTCPVGYARTGFAIWDGNGKQCVKVQGEMQARASLVGKPACKAGEFEDGRNGGECWSCPAATTRTVFPVHEGRACERTGGYVYAKATQTQANMLGCGTGLGSDKSEAFFDAIPSANANVQGRIRAQNNGNLPAGVGNSGVAGTCWSCPSGYTRSLSTEAIWTDTACRSVTMVWGSTSYNQPGLFGLDGGPEVALALVKERTAIDAIADGLAPQLGLSSADSRKNVWNQIATDPQHSGALTMAAFARAMAAVIEPDKASAAEARLARSFAEAVRKFQVFVAQDAVNAYQAWKVTWDRREKERGDELVRTKNMGQVFNIPVGVPPDFEEITFNNIMGNMAAVGSLNAAATMTMAMSKTSFDVVSKAIYPYAFRAGTKTPEAAAKLLAATWQRATASAKWVSGVVNPGEITNVAGGTRFVTKAVIEKTAQASGKAAARAAVSGANGLSKLFSIGPQIIISAAIEFISALIQDLVAREEALPKLQARLKAAEQPVDLARLLRTEAGAAQVMDDWSKVMGGETKPSLPAYAEAAKIALAAYASTAPAAAAKAPAAAGNWVQLPGAGNNVAIGANGALWALGTASSDANGFEIFRMEGSNWVKVPGAGLRLAVDPAGNGWVINRRGQISRWESGRWVLVPGPAASDISIGRSGKVWIVGTAPEGAGFGLHRLDGSNWVKIPGAGVRIAVDSIGNAAVVTNRGTIWHYNGSSWQEMPGAAVEIAIGAGGHVWVLGVNKLSTGYGLWNWSGASWTAVAGALTGLAVAPDGKPLGVSSNGQIWRFQ